MGFARECFSKNSLLAVGAIAWLGGQFAYGAADPDVSAIVSNLPAFDSNPD
jgi:hypothetical protein